MHQTNMADMSTPKQSVKGLSFKGLWQVFYQPSAFFASLKDNPRILVPYIAVGIVCLLAFGLIADLMVEMQVESPQAAERLQGQELTPQMLTFMKWSSIIFPTLAFLLYPLLVAALVLVFGNFVMAGQATFKPVLSVALYGTFIYMVGVLVLAPMMLAKGTVMVSLSLGVLAASEGPQSPLYQALSKIGVFNIWEIIVVGIGLSIVYGVARNKGYLLSVLSIGLLSLIGVLWAWLAQVAF